MQHFGIVHEGFLQEILLNLEQEEVWSTSVSTVGKTCEVGKNLGGHLRTVHEGYLQHL